MAENDSLRSELNWSDTPGDTARDTTGEGRVLEKRLAAVTLVEVGDTGSVYSFSGVIRYAVRRDADMVTFVDYSGEGAHVSGPALGVVRYRLVDPLRTVVRADRTFVATGRAAWSDDTGLAETVEVTLRGTVLDTGEVAFLTSTFAGSGVAEPAELHVQIPAGW